MSEHSDICASANFIEKLCSLDDKTKRQLLDVISKPASLDKNAQCKALHIVSALKLLMPDIDDKSMRKILIGSRIKQLREEQRLTQDELAKRSGVCQTHISSVERFRICPSTETLEAISTVLCVPLSHIDAKIKDLALTDCLKCDGAGRIVETHLLEFGGQTSVSRACPRCSPD